MNNVIHACTSNDTGASDNTLLDSLLSITLPDDMIEHVKTKLLKKFQTLEKILSANIYDLRQSGIPEETVLSIQSISSIIPQLLKRDIEKAPILSTSSNLIDYLHVTMSHQQQEQIRLLCLNKNNALISDDIHATGTIDHAPAYPREIIKHALNTGASALILVHNHPSGDPNPSKDDILLTQKIIAAAFHCDIIVHDHIIISRRGHTSLKAKGLI